MAKTFTKDDLIRRGENYRYTLATEHGIYTVARNEDRRTTWSVYFETTYDGGYFNRDYLTTQGRTQTGMMARINKHHKQMAA